MRLLLVEDDKLLGDGIQAGLIQSGYAVDWMETGESAEAALQTEDYELRWISRINYHGHWTIAEVT